MAVSWRYLVHTVYYGCLYCKVDFFRGMWLNGSEICVVVYGGRIDGSDLYKEGYQFVPRRYKQGIHCPVTRSIRRLTRRLRTI